MGYCNGDASEIYREVKYLSFLWGKEIHASRHWHKIPRSVREKWYENNVIYEGQCNILRDCNKGKCRSIDGWHEEKRDSLRENSNQYHVPQQSATLAGALAYLWDW